MKHPDYRYVEVAKGGVHNRGKIYDIGKLGDPTGLEETYCTYFRFNQDMTDHYKETGGIAKYKGRAWSDWLPIDIDSSDLKEAQTMLKMLFQNLEDYEVDLNTIRVYFSGSKGFHVMIPTETFQAEPSADINDRFKKLALRISDGITIDPHIYDKTRIFRLPNTIHGGSGLYKRELYYFQATNLTIEEIKQLATAPTPKLDIETDVDPSTDLTILFHEDLTKRKPKKTDHPQTQYKPCMQTMMQGVGDGERNEVAMRIGSHLKHNGLSHEMAWSALDTWNDTNDPPMETDQLTIAFEQSQKEYDYGCKDPIKMKYCQRNCLLYENAQEIRLQSGLIRSKNEHPGVD